MSVSQTFLAREQAGRAREHRTAPRWPFWEAAAFAAVLFVTANPIAHSVRATHDVSYAALHPLNVWVYAIASAAFLPWLVVLKREPREAIAAWRAGAGHLLLALMATASAAWSMHPKRSLVLGVQLLAATALALLLRARVSAVRQTQGVLAATGALALVSAVMIIGWPRYGLSGNLLYYQAWTGAFADKNNLALVAMLLIVAALSLVDRLPRLGVVAAVITGVTLLWGCRSVTASLTLAATLGVIACCRFSLRLTRRRAAVFGCVLLGASLLAAANYSTFARLAGRGTTLTGRTILWRSVSEAILDAPWLGHGYRAYFHKGAPAESETRHAMESQMQGERPEAAIVPEASPDVPLQVEWRLFHSHNGFLEVALDLGIPALALLLASLGFQVWPALRRVARGTAQEADVAHLGWLAALVVHNITEVSFLRGWHPEGLLWYLALASAPPRYSPDEIRALAPESRR